MNILLVTSKEDKSDFEAVINSARNANLVSTLCVIKNTFLDEIEERYHPHTIVWVNGVNMSNGETEAETLTKIRTVYPYIRIIYFTGGEDYDDIANVLIGLKIYDIVNRNITSIEFNELLEKPLKSKNEVEAFNLRKFVVYKQGKKVHHKFNLRLLLPVIMLCVVAAITIVALVIKNGSTANAEEAATEEETVKNVENITESPTLFMLATVAPTELLTEAPKQKATEKTTKEKNKATEKGTEKATEKQQEQQPVQQSAQQQEVVQQPVQQPAQQQPVQQQPVQQPVQQPAQQPAQQQPVQQPAQQQETINDDGQIHFDRESYAVKVGENFTITVSGVSASQGMRWNVNNSEIVKFVSATTTTVTVKATTAGTAIITGTAKSNGATRSVIVTVQ